jgi:CHAT domain-containing protein/lipoprotein NlpI
VGEELSDEEHELVDKHFFTTPVRREKLRFALALKKRKAVLNSRRFGKRKLFSFYLPIAASVILAVGVGTVVWRSFGPSDLDKGLAALRNAYRDRRPIEGRIADFNYAPFPELRGNDQGPVDYMSRDRGERIIHDTVNDRPDAAALHALGQAYLARREYDQAIDQFEKALKLDANNAKLQSDMGAALVERGKAERLSDNAGKSVETFARSLEHFNKALELDPSLLDALFNRALLYEYMMLPTQAEADWRSFLKRDSQSQWANEAQEHLKLIEEQNRKTSQTPKEILQEFLRAYESRQDDVAWRLLSGYHNRIGNVIVEQLLDGCLEGNTEGPQPAPGYYPKLLIYVGEMEQARSGDLFFSHLAKYYQSVTAEQRADLVEARQLLKAGHSGWGRARVDESSDLFSRAKRLYDKAGDIYESKVAEYWLVFCYFRQRDRAHTLSVLTQLISACEIRGFKHLLARALYLQSITQFDILNELSKAIDSASRSLELAEQMSDTVGTVNALSSLIEYFRHLGNYEKSLSYIQRSLAWANLTSIDPVQGSRHFGLIATALASASLYAAAADYQKEALRFAVSTGNASVMASNYIFMGIINGKLKNHNQALNDFQHAYEIAQSHSNEASDRGLMAYALLQTGHIYRLMEDFDRSLISYTKALELYEGIDQPTDIYYAHKGKAYCYLAQKNVQLAQEEIRKALSLIEDYRNKITEDSNRESFFDAEQSLYDVAIDLAYSQVRGTEEAFRLSEASRARSLLDLMNSDVQMQVKDGEQSITPESVSLPLSYEEIRDRLPEQTQIVQYAVLENKLIIWVISKDGISATSREINQNELSNKVISYLGAISSPTNTGGEEAARELFDLLIKPAQSWLDGSKQICIVPDKVLNYLPFGALISSTSGKYLLEDYILVVSPSSTMYVVCSEIARQKEGIKAERLLSVGNPTFNRNAYPSLPLLPTAAKEAVDVGFFYNSPKTLIESEAVADAVKREMVKADVIHLALHTVLDDRFPLRSKLLLAEEPTSASDGQPREGAISAYEIYGMRLPQARLVILAACQTGVERYYKGEGMLSLMRPFLAARVPLVVASLWPVDSPTTSQLMLSFHRHRKVQGLSSVEALRNAQLEMLHGAEARLHHPFYWAPFVITGGYAKF